MSPKTRQDSATKRKKPVWLEYTGIFLGLAIGTGAMFVAAPEIEALLVKFTRPNWGNLILAGILIVFSLAVILWAYEDRPNRKI